MLRFDPFQLDPAGRQLLRDGRALALQPKLFDVLHYLTRHPGRALSRAELLAACWPRQDVGDAVLARSIKELRRVLDDDAAEPRFIRTLPRVGYAFIAPMAGAHGPMPAPPQPAAAEATGPIALAIVPPSTDSPDADARSLALGLAEHLAAVLSQHTGLRVRPVASALALAHRGMDASAVAQTLQADLALAGSLRRVGTRWQATLALREVGTPRVRAAELIEAPLDAPRALVETTLAWVRSALPEAADEPPSGAAAGGALTGLPTTRPAAYRHYLLGRLHLSQHNLPGDRAALAAFEAATAEDPRFAIAWVGVADAHDALGSALPDPARATAARDAARRALALEPSLVPALGAMGKVAWRQDLDWAEAERCFDTALAQAPHDVAVLCAASDCYSMLGRSGQAIALATHAVEMDPASPFCAMLLGQALHMGGLHAEALEPLRAALRRYPDFAFAHLFAGLALQCLGRLDESLAHVERAAALSGRDDVAGGLVVALARSGRRDEARRRLAALEAGGNDAAIAMALHGLGEHDAALARFARVAARRDWRFLLLHHEPAFAELRARPGAQGLWPAGVPRPDAVRTLAPSGAPPRPAPPRRTTPVRPAP
jgi:DNA-binding winged helix-turn-helix (wHTH) protein/tetratricopeptide (TPR) repeat protein